MELIVLKNCREISFTSDYFLLKFEFCKNFLFYSNKILKKKMKEN